MRLPGWSPHRAGAITKLAFSIARGHLGAWIEAQVELVRLLPETLRARRIVQRSRVVADRDLLIAEPLTLNPGIASRGIGAAVRRTLDAAFCGWWRLVRGLCG